MMEHSVTLRVRYGETDQMGVVYHANYLHYFETGRTELLRAAGAPYAELENRGVFLVVTGAELRYRAAARYDDLLRIVTRVASVGKASVRFETAIFGGDGRRLTEGAVDLASVDASRKPVRLPEDIASLLR